MVRWGELSGIDVTDETGEVALGRSAAAGKDAIQKCCAARVIWTTPVLMGVPLMMAPPDDADDGATAVLCVCKKQCFWSRCYAFGGPWLVSAFWLI